MEIKKNKLKLVSITLASIGVFALLVTMLPQKASAIVDFVPSDSLSNNQLMVGPVSGIDSGSLLKSAAQTNSFYPTAQGFKITAVSQAVDYGKTATLSWSAPAVPNISCNVMEYAYGGVVIPYRKVVQPTMSGYVTGPLTEDRRIYVFCNADNYRSVSSIWIKVNAPKAVDPKVSVYPESISYGQSGYVSWNGGNASKCSLTKDGVAFNTKTTGFQISTGRLTKNTEFKLTCTGTAGTKTASSVVKVGAANAPSVTLSPKPITVVYGSSTAVSWSSTNATNCSVSLDGKPWKTGVKGDNVMTPALKTNATIAITCSGANGSISDSTIVGINAWLPTVYSPMTFKAVPSIIQAGESTNLSWDSGDSNAKCNLSTNYYNRTEPVRSVPAMVSEVTGFKVGPLSDWVLYGITCDTSAGKKNAQLWVKVNSASAPVTTLTADLKADKTSISSGQSVNLTWTTKGANICTLSNGKNSNWKSGLTGTNVSSGPIASTTDFILNCGDGVDTIRKVVTITVASSTKPDTGNGEVVEPCVYEKPTPGSNKIDTPQTLLCKDVEKEPTVTPVVTPTTPYTPVAKFFDYSDRLGQILEVDKVEVKAGTPVKVNWMANPEHLASCSLNKYEGTKKTEISSHHTGSSVQTINTDTDFIFDCRRYGTHNHYYAKMKVKVLGANQVAEEPADGSGRYFNATQSTGDDGQNTIFLIADRLVAEKGGKIKVAWSEATLNTTYTPYCHIYKTVAGKTEEISSSNNGIIDVVINADTQIKVDCRRSYSHNHVTQTLNLKLDQKKLVGIQAFGAVPTYLTKPAPVTVSWQTNDAVSCSLLRDNQPWATIPAAQLAKGSTTTEPLQKTTDFRITCKGRIEGDSRTNNSIVTVTPQPTVNVAPTATITATPTEVVKGSVVKVVWSSTNADSCTVYKDTTSWKTGLSNVGITSEPINQSTVFWMTCKGKGGTASAKAIVQVK